MKEMKVKYLKFPALTITHLVRSCPNTATIYVQCLCNRRLILLDLMESTATQICSGQTPGGTSGDFTSCTLEKPRGILPVNGNIYLTTMTACGEGSMVYPGGSSLYYFKLEHFCTSIDQS